MRFPGIESDQADERDGGVSVQCTTDTDAIDEIKNKKSLTAIRQTSGDFWRAFHCVEAPQVAPHEAPEAGPRSTHKERRNARRGHSSAASFSKKVSPARSPVIGPRNEPDCPLAVATSSCFQLTESSPDRSTSLRNGWPLPNRMSLKVYNDSSRQVKREKEL